MKPINQGIAAIALSIAAFLPTSSFACGGFFCQVIPINQAAEQIVFRQDGDQITAMVQIQFEGNAPDFSWVVPVPSTPTYEVGSNTTFTDLERATRPQFNLTFEGEQCFSREAISSPTAIADSSGGGESGGVVIESVQDVGGYVVTLISGNNADEVTQWLVDNDYDLSDTGRELLAPYVEGGMKFVAVKLQQNRGTGSIQPLIMKYQSDKPVVPIRLTAVAAVEDMGVLVWLLGGARAVPENYLHVTPNYTRLDWFGGSRNAYGSYQSLITDAMNEAGGQGFATDFAGRLPDLQSSLTTPDSIQQQLNRLSGSPDVEYVSLVQGFISDPIVVDTLTTALPLPDGQGAFQYQDQGFLTSNYTASELGAARSAVDAAIRAEVIEPLKMSNNVLGGNRYMTRLYTTLSADEMTLDPAFVFNSDMGDQQRDRNATLKSACINNEDHWTLQLGAGTGRTDEVVIDTIGPVPFTAPVIDQDASWKLEETAASGQPVVRTIREFQVASLGSPGTGITDGTGTDGTGTGTGTDGTGTGTDGTGTGTDTDGDGSVADPDGTSTPTRSSSGGGTFGILLLTFLVGVRRISLK